LGILETGEDNPVLWVSKEMAVGKKRRGKGCCWRGGEKKEREDKILNQDGKVHIEKVYSLGFPRGSGKHKFTVPRGKGCSAYFEWGTREAR